MNRVCLIGRITKDLELRQTTSGKSVCEFTIAVNRDKDNADFINIQVWNAQAENLVKYQSKGNLIGVDGSLRIDSFDKSDGTRGYKTYVLANNIEYLSSKETKTETKETKKQEEESDPFAEFGETVEREMGDKIDDNFLD